MFHFHLEKKMKLKNVQLVSQDKKPRHCSCKTWAYISKLCSSRLYSSCKSFLSCDLTHPTPLWLRDWRVSKEAALTQIASREEDHLFCFQEQSFPEVKMLNVIQLIGGKKSKILFFSVPSGIPFKIHVLSVPIIVC